MANNLNVRITGDTADLTAKLAVAQVAAKDYGKTLRELARQQLAGDGSEETKQKALAAAEGYQQAKGQAEIYNKALVASKYSQDQVKVSSGSMKAGMQSLSYQLNDVSTMFAMGAKPMQIFASQGSQVIQSLQMMNGSTKGVMGVLGGPWGAVMISAATMMVPFISKLLESENALKDVGEAADDAMAKLRQSMGEASAVSEALTANSNAMVTKMAELGKVNVEIAKTRQIIKGMSSDTLTAALNSRALSDAQNRLSIQMAKAADLQKEIAKYRGDIDETLSAARAKNLQADAQRRLNDLKAKDKPRDKKSGGDGDAKKAEREAEEAARAALQEQLNSIRQQQALSEEAAQIDVQLSRMALQSKLADVEARARAEQITAAEAIQLRADLNNQLAALDGDLAMRLYSAQLLQLNQSRDLYGQQSAEYADYTRRIELLHKAHLGRMSVAKAETAEREKQVARDLAEQQLQTDRRTAQQKRQIMDQTYRPYAQQIANMITLQQGFGQTVRGIWSSLTGAVNQAISNMVMSFITGLFLKEAASDRFHMRETLKSAKEAAANAWAATAKIPIIGPIAAPVAAAAAFAGVMAFSAEDGWDVPGGAGAGVDGKGGRLSIIHPREMVLPAQIADTVRMSAASMENAGAISTGAVNPAALRAALATSQIIMSDSVASARPARLARQDAGQMRAGSYASASDALSQGRAGIAPGAAASGSITINAVDARSVTRLLKDNNRGVARALQRAVRGNFRPS